MEGKEDFQYMAPLEPPKDCLELSVIERPTPAFYGLVYDKKTYVPLEHEIQNKISEAVTQTQRITFKATETTFVNVERHSFVYVVGDKTGIEYPIVVLPGRGMLDSIYIVSEKTAFEASNGLSAMLKEANGDKHFTFSVPSEDQSFGVEWAYATQKETLHVAVDDELTEAINNQGGMKAFGEKKTVKVKGVEWALTQEGSHFILADGSFQKRVLPIPSLWLFTNADNKLEPFPADASRQIEHCYRNGVLSTVVNMKNTSFTINLSTEPFFEIRHQHFLLRHKVVRFGLSLSRKHTEFLKLARQFQTIQTQLPEEWALSALMDSEPKKSVYVLDPERNKEEYDEVLGFIKHKREIPPKGIAFSDAGFQNTGTFKQEESKTTEPEPEYEIVSIKRLMNPAVFSRFREYANKISAFWGSCLEQESPSSKYLHSYSDCDCLYDARINEYYMWHGGGKEETDFIMRTQRFQLEDQVDYPFGKGVYFSESFTQALRFCRCRHCNGSLLTPPMNRSRQCFCETPKEAPVHTVFLCRTVLGNPLIVRDRYQFFLHQQQSDKEPLRDSAKRSTFDGLGEQSPLPSFGVTMDVVIVYDQQDRSSRNQADDIESELVFNRYQPKRVDINTMDAASHELNRAVVHFCMSRSKQLELLKTKLRICVATDSFYYWVPKKDETVANAVNDVIEHTTKDATVFHRQMIHPLECNDGHLADSTFVEDQHSGMPSSVDPKELKALVTNSGRELARSPFRNNKFDKRSFVVYNTLASYPFYAVEYRLRPTDATAEPSPERRAQSA